MGRVLSVGHFPYSPPINNPEYVEAYSTNDWFNFLSLSGSLQAHAFLYWVVKKIKLKFVVVDENGNPSAREFIFQSTCEKEEDHVCGNEFIVPLELTPYPINYGAWLGGGFYHCPAFARKGNLFPANYDPNSTFLGDFGLFWQDIYLRTGFFIGSAYRTPYSPPSEYGTTNLKFLVLNTGHPETEYSFNLTVFKGGPGLQDGSFELKAIEYFSYDGIYDPGTGAKLT